MFLIITYDVNVTTKEGKRRLQKVAKVCVNYGVRVQNSVFECIMDPATELMVRNKLVSIIDEKVDSLRFYYLGDHYQNKVKHIGANVSLKLDDPMIF